MNDLESVLTLYRAGTMGRERMYRVIVTWIAETLTRRFRLDTDDQLEVISNLYPTIERSIQAYRDTGSSFESYLFVQIRYAAIALRRERSQQFVTETPVPFGCDDEIAIPAYDSPPSTSVASTDPTYTAPLYATSRKRDAVRRHLLISLCRNLPILGADEIEHYRVMFGLPRAWIDAVLTYCSDCRRDHDDRIESYRLRRDRHWASMMKIQRSLVYGSADPARVEFLRSRLRFHRRRWRFYILRLKRAAVHLSHREVAILLGIPKGSVDSAMANLGSRVAAYVQTRYAARYA